MVKASAPQPAQLGISEALLHQWRQRRQSAGSHGSSGQVKEIRKQLKQAEWERERGIKKNFDHLQPPELKTIYTFITDEMKGQFPINSLKFLLMCIRRSKRYEEFSNQLFSVIL